MKKNIYKKDKSFNKFLKTEFIIIIGLTLTLIFFSYFPLLTQFLTSKNKVFLGSYGFPPDFFGNYISFQQGRLGHFQRTAKITSTISSKPNLIKIDYVLLGQLNRLIPLPPMLFFHLTRLLLSLSFIFLSYLLIKKIFKKAYLRITAFVLAFFSTSISFGWAKLIFLWTPLGVFQREAYYHHYLFSFCFLLLSLIFLIKTIKTNKPTLYLILTLLFGFLTSLIHPPVIITFYLSFPFYLLTNLLKNRKNLIKKVFILTIYTLITSLPLIYLYQKSFTHPWNIISPVDLAYNISSKINCWQFFLGIGPTLILAIIGYLLILKQKKENIILEFLGPWSIIYILGFFSFFKLLKFNSIRFLQTPFFVFLGILSTLALKKLTSSCYQKRIKQKIVIVATTILIIILSLPSLYTSFKLNFENFYLNQFTWIYASKEKHQALTWLCQNTKENDVVFSTEDNGLLIAALCGNFTYLTNHAQPLNSYVKLKQNVKDILKQNLKDNKACSFLKQENIKFIFLGPEERQLNNNMRLRYSCLGQAYQNSQVIIYQVN